MTLTEDQGGSLSGRVAIVTGAGRGIGAAVATLLAAEGAQVIVNDLGVNLDGSGGDESQASQVASAIRAGGGVAEPDAHDVSDFDEAHQLVDHAIESFGRLDVLVNVAGILRDRMIFNMSESEWDDVIRVHLKGTFNTCHHVSKYWRQLRDPNAHNRLINFISGAGLYGAPGQPNYSAAKAGIVGLTMSCANSLGKYGVTANAIAPAAGTRMGQTVPAEHDRPERKVFLTDEYGPESVAPVVGYLAGTRSSWCSGRVLGARGYRVLLYSNPEPVRQLISPTRWTVESLGSMMESAFLPLPTEFNPFRVAPGAEVSE